MDCTHHWIIDTPAGRFSAGICRLCEKIRTNFCNYYEDIGWSHTPDEPLAHVFITSHEKLDPSHAKKGNEQSKRSKRKETKPSLRKSI